MQLFLLLLEHWLRLQITVEGSISLGSRSSNIYQMFVLRCLGKHEVYKFMIRGAPGLTILVPGKPVKGRIAFKPS